MTRPQSKRDFLRGDSLTSAIRILATMTGFRREFGDWPQRILMDSGMADAIQQDVLTHHGWELLAEKCELLKIDEGTVIAEGCGNTYEYGSSENELIDLDVASRYIWGVNLIE